MRGRLLFGVSLAVLAAPSAGRAQSAAEFAELKQMVRTLQQRIEQLEAQQRAPGSAPGASEAANRPPPAGQPQRAQGAEAASPAVVPAPPEHPAEAPKVVMSARDKVKLTVSGQVDRAILAHNDSHQTDFYQVDNNNSSSRLRALGDAKITDDVTATSAIEFDLRSNTSAAVSRGSVESNGGDTPTLGVIRIRRAEVGVTSQTLGTLQFGRGWTATDSITEIDRSGTALASYATQADIGAACRSSRRPAAVPRTRRSPRSSTASTGCATTASATIRRTSPASSPRRAGRRAISSTRRSGTRARSAISTSPPESATRGSAPAR